MEFTSTKRPRDSTAGMGKCEQRSEAVDEQTEFPLPCLQGPPRALRRNWLRLTRWPQKSH